LNNYVNEIDNHIDNLKKSNNYETFNPKSEYQSPSRIEFSNDNNKMNTNQNNENMNSYQRLISQLDDEHDNEIFLQTEKALQEIKDNFKQSPIRNNDDKEQNRNIDVKQSNKTSPNIQDLKIFSNESKSK